MNTQAKTKQTKSWSVAINAIGLTMVMLLMFSSSALADDTPFRIGFTKLECIEETDEIGADSPYGYMIAGNLRTGETSELWFNFEDVDQGETHFSGESGTSRLIGEWPHIQKADELVILVVLREKDRPVLKFVSTPPNQFSRLALPSFKQQQKAYEQGNMSRGAVVDALTTAVGNEALGEDEMIGVFELPISSSELSTAGQRFITKTHAIQGDGGQYRFTFLAVSSPRKLWIHSNGYFLRTSNNAWDEYQNGSKRFTFEQTRDSTVEFVGLHDRDRDVFVRLYSDKCQVRSPNSQFSDFYVGRWGRPGEAQPGTETISGSGVVTGKDKFAGQFQRAQEKLDKPSVPPGGKITAVDLSGTWKSNVGVIYEIKQSGTTFTWTAPLLKETAEGSLSGNDRLKVDFNSAYGPGSVAGKVANKDSTGKATRIEWDNQTVFTRHSNPSVPPATVGLTGTWKSNQGVIYEIKQNGNAFTWTAPVLKETANGKLLGNDRLKVNWNGAFGAGSTKGKITTKDAKGRPQRIQWDTGTVFNRQ